MQCPFVFVLTSHPSIIKGISKILLDNKLANKLSSNAKNLAVPEASLNLKEIVLKIVNGDIIEFKN